MKMKTINHKINFGTIIFCVKSMKVGGRASQGERKKKGPK